jgi:hypothetical protein
MQENQARSADKGTMEAPMIDHPEARAILAEFGIEAVHPSSHLKPGQTKAVASLQKIVRKRGYDHARFVIMTWSQTMIKKAPMDAATMWAISDAVVLVEKNFPHLLNNDVETWFRFIDALQIGWIQEWAKSSDGVIPRRFAIAAMIFERLQRLFGIRQLDMLDDRRIAHDKTIF